MKSIIGMTYQPGRPGGWDWLRQGRQEGFQSSHTSVFVVWREQKEAPEEFLARAEEIRRKSGCNFD